MLQVVIKIYNSTNIIKKSTKFKGIMLEKTNVEILLSIKNIRFFNIVYML